MPTCEHLDSFYVCLFVPFGRFLLNHYHLSHHLVLQNRFQESEMEMFPGDVSLANRGVLKRTAFLDQLAIQVFTEVKGVTGRVLLDM